MRTNELIKNRGKTKMIQLTEYKKERLTQLIKKVGLIRNGIALEEQIKEKFKLKDKEGKEYEYGVIEQAETYYIVEEEPNESNLLRRYSVMDLYEQEFGTTEHEQEELIGKLWRQKQEWGIYHQENYGRTKEQFLEYIKNNITKGGIEHADRYYVRAIAKEEAKNAVILTIEETAEGITKAHPNKIEKTEISRDKEGNKQLIIVTKQLEVQTDKVLKESFTIGTYTITYTQTEKEEEDKYTIKRNEGAIEVDNEILISAYILSDEEGEVKDIWQGVCFGAEKERIKKQADIGDCFLVLDKLLKLINQPSWEADAPYREWELIEDELTGISHCRECGRVSSDCECIECDGCGRTRRRTSICSLCEICASCCECGRCELCPEYKGRNSVIVRMKRFDFVIETCEDHCGYDKELEQSATMHELINKIKEIRNKLYNKHEYKTIEVRQTQEIMTEPVPEGIEEQLRRM